MGLSFNGDTIKEKSLGGSETAAYYMAKEIAAQGHQVTMFTTSDKEGVFDGVKYVYAGQATEQTPLGDRFHYYAESTPHDVLIIQRHPAAFRYNWASKVNLWWVHDLAIVRQHQVVETQLWNVDGVLTVSKFHKEQICNTYNINPDVVYPIQNGIDLELFKMDVDNVFIKKGEAIDPVPLNGLNNKDQVKLLYTSRPERGLENLVGPGAIMDRLAEIDPKYHLYVCGYDNTTPQMKAYYDYLHGRCDAMPNVTNIGNLTKQELADVMRQCDALVYPTPGPQQPGFEEVSCITAMECMAAGLPFISTTKGALPETCKDSGAILIDVCETGLPCHGKFVDEVVSIGNKIKDGSVSAIKEKQLAAAPKFAWSVAADMTLNVIKDCFGKHRSKDAVAKQLLMNSDFYALTDYLDKHVKKSSPIIEVIEDEVIECYAFALENRWKDHYAAYYHYEQERGINYGPEDLAGNMRFEHVSGIIASLDSDAVVLDFGCAHGHYTVNLAKRFPDKRFVGVDIDESNIEKANQWVKDEGIDNVRFVQGTIEQDDESKIINVFKYADFDELPQQFDAIIAAEVIEHIKSPQRYIDTLNTYLKLEGLMIITTPYGPWEAQGYEEHYPWRAHVHHLDRADLANLWGHFREYNVAVAPSGPSRWGSRLGSYITTFKNPGAAVSGNIDYERKYATMKPLQTVSVCMIVKNAEDTIKKTLDSVRHIADEIIIAIDKSTTDRTAEIIANFKKDIFGTTGYKWPRVITKHIDPVVDTGFDEARNYSIKDASCDWILWIDSDEILVHPQNVYKYLRNNQYNGYAIRQHHYSAEPAGIMKTDLPCRLFRNRKGIKFFGIVHEHPERGLNEGVGHVQVIPDMEIAHHGYTTEAIRRARFNRNIDLLVRDRKKYPDRVLGKFLWVRDLAQMCKYELDFNGGKITPEMKQRATEGMKLWEELLEGNHLRMIVDGIEFYDILSRILGQGFEFGFTMETSKLNGGFDLNQSKQVRATFHNKDHALKLFNQIFNEKTKTYDSRYY